MKERLILKYSNVFMPIAERKIRFVLAIVGIVFFPIITIIAIDSMIKNDDARNLVRTILVIAWIFSIALFSLLLSIAMITMNAEKQKREFEEKERE